MEFKTDCSMRRIASGSNSPLKYFWSASRKSDFGLRLSRTGSLTIETQRIRSAVDGVELLHQPFQGLA
jgi:hypothetical protein